VLRRSAEPGSEVAEAGELLTLAPDGSVVFEAHVPRTEAAEIPPGTGAEVSMEGGGKVATRVQRRLPQTNEADQTALFWLAPVVKAPFGVLGRFGNAVIEIGTEHRAVLVPDSALVEDDLTGEIRMARVAPGDVAVWTTVRIGPGAEGRHELLSPLLPPGTPVVVRGQRGLPDSTRVKAEP
jgi:multidrug efflux pump subunit AcrA (membrane-fusion protein)